MPDNPVQTVINQSRYPAELAPHFRYLSEAAGDVSRTPYTPYGQPRLAGFTQPEIAAQQGIVGLGLGGGPAQVGAATRGMAGAYGQMGEMIPQMGNAATGSADRSSQLGGIYESLYPGALASGQTGAANLRSLGAQSSGVPSLLDTDISAYMNPYIENVLDVQRRRAMETGRRMKSELGSYAAHSGAFGGSRHGLMRGQLDRDVMREMMDLDQVGMSQAYDNALSAFNADRMARLSGIGQGISAEQAAIGAGQGGYNLAGNMISGALGAEGQAYGAQNAGFGQMMQGIGSLGTFSGNLAGLGAQEQGMALERLGAAEQVGARQRAMQQAGLDVGYEDFNKQRDWLRNNLGWYSGILNALPQQPTQQVSTYQQRPGLFQSILGTGVAGLGAYNAVRQ